MIRRDDIPTTPLATAEQCRAFHGIDCQVLRCAGCDSISRLLRHAGEHRISLTTAAHEIDPDGTSIGIRTLVRAIDLKNAEPATCAGDYYHQCIAAADRRAAIPLASGNSPV